MTVKISHQPDKGSNLALERCLPPIRIRPVERRKIGVVVGISEKDIPACRNLRTGSSGENKANENDSGYLNKACKRL
jgi:hypothetical protein